MPPSTSITLAAGDPNARATFLTYLTDAGRGLIVVLGADQSAAFTLAKNNADTGGDPTISAIWAQVPTVIQADLAGLAGSNAIVAGTKTVAVNRIKGVNLCLDAVDSIAPAQQLLAYLAAGANS